MELESRIRILERKNSRNSFLIWIFASAILFAMYFYSQAKEDAAIEINQVVKARQFMVVDKTGNVTAILGDVEDVPSELGLLNNVGLFFFGSHYEAGWHDAGKRDRWESQPAWDSVTVLRYDHLASASKNSGERSYNNWLTIQGGVSPFIHLSGDGTGADVVQLHSSGSDSKTSIDILDKVNGKTIFSTKQFKR